MQVLITGVAGFIGYHVAERLLSEGIHVYGIDNLNDYYDVNLKRDRLLKLKDKSHFKFQILDLSNHQEMIQLFSAQKFEYVINLAAQAGVRYSLLNPLAYVDSNLTGFVNLLEACRHSTHSVKHLVFASSSSVYGANTKLPFSTKDFVDFPVSLYAATKKANELIAHTYSHLYHIPATGLRFFTVYGPWGRPDMAYFKFVRAIEEGEPIDVYNFGEMQRDFTYIDDVVEGIIRVMYRPPINSESAISGTSSTAPYKIYNIGHNKPVALGKFIEVIEQTLGKEAKKNFLPMQPGDVPATYADIDDLVRDTGFQPSTPIEQGIAKFVEWYKAYYI